jgi:hypothetical protein
MNTRRVVWFGVSALAIASWFASASTSGVRRPAIPAPSPARSADMDRSAAALQSEVGRLHERLAPTALPTHARDLFRFSSRPIRHAAAPSPARENAGAVDAPSAAPSRPALTLIGIAEDAQGDQEQRTAILAGLGDVFLAKPGDVIGGHFRVEQVSADAAQITDTTSSVSTTLALH